MYTSASSSAVMAATAHRGRVSRSGRARTAVVCQFSPVLFQPFGDSDPHARLQFRTAIEVHALPVGSVELGGGYFHISNGTLNRRNADIDALFLSLRLRF